MAVSNLQLALIVAGVVLVVAVIIYNAWQERRLHRRSESAVRPTDAAPVSRVEPTLRSMDNGDGATAMHSTRVAPAHAAAASRAAASAESSFAPPMDVIAHDDAAVAEADKRADTTPLPAGDTRYAGVQPDPDIESILTIEISQPVNAGALSAGFNARIGKPVRWFGRRDGGGPWQLLSADSSGIFVEVIATMLLADRNGAASKSQIEAFQRLVVDVAASLPAHVSGPDVDSEVKRADSLDRLCADIDVQIGLTVVKSKPRQRH